MDKYKRYYLAGYIEDLWFVIRKLRDLKLKLLDFGFQSKQLTDAQNSIKKLIPKLQKKLKKMEQDNG